MAGDGLPGLSPAEGHLLTADYDHVSFRGSTLNPDRLGGGSGRRPGRPVPAEPADLLLGERFITGDRLIDELDRLAAGRDYPAVLRCDNGPSCPTPL